MSRPLRWTLILVTLTLAAFILRLPAALPARWLPADISLAGLQGSVWHGSAAALGVKGLVTQEELRWQLQPRALLRGQLLWQVSGTHAGRDSQLRLIAGFHGVTIEGLQLHLPLEPFTQFDPTAQGLRLRGDLQINSERLAPGLPIGLDARLTRVSSAMAGEASALGGYQARVDADAAGAGNVSITTLNGPLQIAGGGSFALRARSVDLQLRLKPETDLPGLSPALATLPREQDSYLLSIRQP